MADEYQILPRLAQRLRNAYTRQRGAYMWIRYRRVESVGSGHVASWDGGTDQYNVRHKPVWLKLAEQLLQAGHSDAEGFISAQFSGSAKLTTPNQLMSRAAFAKYSYYVRYSENVLDQDLISQTREFDMAVLTTQTWLPNLTLSEIWQHVICNTSWTLSPLFRYCIAVSENMVTASEQWRPLAYDELSNNPVGYCNCWKKVLPPGALAFARQLIGLE